MLVFPHVHFFTYIHQLLCCFIAKFPEFSIYHVSVLYPAWFARIFYLKLPFCCSCWSFVSCAFDKQSLSDQFHEAFAHLLWQFYSCGSRFRFGVGSWGMDGDFTHMYVCVLCMYNALRGQVGFAGTGVTLYTHGCWEPNLCLPVLSSGFWTAVVTLAKGVSACDFQHLWDWVTHSQGCMSDFTLAVKMMF